MTILAGNAIRDLKTQIRGGRWRNRARATLVTTNGTGKLVERSTMAGIQLMVVKGGSSSINIMEICYRTARWLIQSCRGRHNLSPAETDCSPAETRSMPAENNYCRLQKPRKVTIRNLLLHRPRHWHVSPQSHAFKAHFVTE